MSSRAFQSAKNFGENVVSGSIVFRTNSNTLSSNVVISSNTNAMVAGPIHINDDVQLTVKGNLTIL